ncbi:MAG TPA: signal peptidase I [Candidatus Dormibacteraeota bacterium]|nr:signal peptidase I [Candidatus Dormibacteraeota bacterium]
MSQVAVPPTPPKTKRGRRTLVRDIIEVLLLAGAIYLVIAFALQTVRVEGESMVPTLQNGDLLFANKISYHFHGPDRGDIVVLIPPESPSRDFIKRVIGLPGDIIKIDGRYVDPKNPNAPPHTAILLKVGGQGGWQVLNEPYLPDQKKDPWTEMSNCCDSSGRATAVPTELTIPKDQYFVMGDNRNFSSDSRSIGLIPRNNIIGKAWIRIWPFSHFGFLGSGPTLTAAGSLVLALPLPLARRRKQISAFLRQRTRAA